MSNKLKLLMERAEHWPKGVQEEVIASIQSIEEELIGLYELSSDDREALKRSEKDVRLGRFASDKQVSDVLERHRQK